MADLLLLLLGALFIILIVLICALAVIFILYLFVRHYYIVTTIDCTAYDVHISCLRKKSVPELFDYIEENYRKMKIYPSGKQMKLAHGMTTIIIEAKAGIYVEDIPKLMQFCKSRFPNEDNDYWTNYCN